MNGFRLSTARRPRMNSETTYGPAAAKTARPSGSAGRPGGTAQKNGIVVRIGKSGIGRVNLITSRVPAAVTPAGTVRVPALTASAPTMSLTYSAPGEFIPGMSMRLIERAKASAWTGFPSLKRAFLRSVKVYVFPSFDTRGGRRQHRARFGVRPVAACSDSASARHRSPTTAPSPGRCRRGPGRGSRVPQASG